MSKPGSYPETLALKIAPANIYSFTFETIVHSKSVMKFAISEVGADRIMIGSDYCLDMGYDQPVHALDEANMNGAQRKLILTDNAARLLKL